MARLRIKKELLDAAAKRATLSDEERITVAGLSANPNKRGTVSVDPAELPLPFLRTLLDDPKLTSNQRAVCAMQVYGMSAAPEDRTPVYEAVVASPKEFGTAFLALGTKQPNCELFLNGRWYPVTMGVTFLKKDDGYLYDGVLLHGQLSICEHTERLAHFVYPEFFLDESGHNRPRSVIEVLEHFGFRRLQTKASDFNLRLVRAERESREAGTVVRVSGPVLWTPANSWWCKLQSRSLGTPESPRRAVVEHELEINEENRYYYGGYGHEGVAPSRLPFVRVFSLDTKSYVFVDVDDVAPCEFDDRAMDRLHLPNAMQDVLGRVFATDVEDLFGDLIEGKHGGVVVLACGNPGVGKTLTAEVYAEQTERPLYVLELGELGTNVALVEENLNRVFTRVARWNAVLQFDECEIFLTERGDDLERSAIVGIFLRLLDYYRGILFLTTNRPDVLDRAVRSRVMLRLDYPDLDQAARAAVWRTMFESAGMELVEAEFSDLAEEDLNGRQIRNLTRLARVVHADGRVTLEQMRHILTYGCG